MFSQRKYICEVYKEQSISKAAKNLFVSQSSLSITIKNAEKRIGMTIFDRTSHPLQLTEFGKMYIEACEEIDATSRRLNDWIYDVNNLKKGRLTIGVNHFMAVYLVAPVISKFNQKYSNIQINVVEGTTAELLQELKKRNADLLLTDYAVDLPNFRQQELSSEMVVLAVPSIILHEIPCKESILLRSQLIAKNLDQIPDADLSKFSDVPFIRMRTGTVERSFEDQIFGEWGFSPKHVLEINQIDTALALATNGMGACMVPSSIAYKLAETRVLFFKIKQPENRMNLSFFYRDGIAEQVLITAFMETCQNELNRLLFS